MRAAPSAVPNWWLAHADANLKRKVAFWFIPLPISVIKKLVASHPLVPGRPVAFQKSTTGLKLCSVPSHPCPGIR